MRSVDTACKVAQSLNESADWVPYVESLLYFVRDKKYEIPLCGSASETFKSVMTTGAIVSSDALTRTLTLLTRVFSEHREARMPAEEDISDEEGVGCLGYDHVDVLCTLFRATRTSKDLEEATATLFHQAEVVARAGYTRRNDEVRKLETLYTKLVLLIGKREPGILAIVQPFWNPKPSEQE